MKIQPSKWCYPDTRCPTCWPLSNSATLAPKLKMGSTVIASAGTVPTMPASATGLMFDIELDCALEAAGLPASVQSDICVTMRPYEFPRFGTSLLNAEEARTMVDYLFSSKETS